tara:strand:+ start:878 stop:1900 length:1023 start_codon:yes stop_codon:yes gene_type:complete
MNSIKIRYATDKDRYSWNDFVYNHEDSTYSHVFEWRDIIGRTYGLKSKYLIFHVGKEIVGLLPLIWVSSMIGKGSWVSVPFTNYGGLICKRKINRNNFIKLTRSVLGKEEKISLRELQSKDEKQVSIATSRLSLTNEDEIWKGFKAKVRNQVRKAIKSKLQISSDIKHLKLFYDKVYVKSMHRLGTPHHSWDFFYRLIKLFPTDKGFITVWHNDHLIAGMLYVVVNDIFYDIAANSLKEYNALCPNNLLYWEAMKIAMDLKCKKFDFGRSTINTGVFNFKQQWGPEVYPIYTTCICKDGKIMLNNNIYESRFYKRSSILWQITPSIITNPFGPAIRRYLP